ncbi:hypothetical protein BsWGS_22707 [Bradybaena similaris]
MAAMRSRKCLTAWLVLHALTFTGAFKLRQSAIIGHIRDASDPDVIPLPDNTDAPLAVNINVWLIKILDVDRDRNEVELLLFQNVSWHNPALSWDVSREGFNETSVTLPSRYLWLPDISIYNSVNLQDVVSPHVVVGNEGFVYYVPSFRAHISCDLSKVDSDSGASCLIRFGSWTQTGNTLTISNSGQGFDLSEYVPIPSYDLLATSATKHSLEYPCCPGVRYEDVTFQFTIRTQTHSQPVSGEKRSWW